MSKETEKLLKSFNKTLVELQYKTLETVMHKPNLPSFPMGNIIPSSTRARVGEKKKLSKKQLAALKRGRRILQKKNRAGVARLFKESQE